MEPDENLVELKISLSAADANEFTEWCEDQGLTQAQGLNKLLLLEKRMHSVGTQSDDKFNKAFAAARGRISPDIDLD